MQSGDTQLYLDTSGTYRAEVRRECGEILRYTKVVYLPYVL